MRNIRRLGVAVAAAAMFTVAVGPAAALVQDWNPDLIAYSYVYYADAEKTQVLGYATDHCEMSGDMVVVIRPYIPTAYYDQTPMYVCSGMGPYLPG